MTFAHMYPIYAYLIQIGARTIEKIPENYRTPVAEYMAAKAEK